MSWTPPRLNKTLAKQVAKAVSSYWHVEVNSLKDIRSAISKGVMQGMSMRERIDNQTAVKEWVNSLSKNELIAMFRYIEEAKGKGRREQYRKKDEVVKRFSSVDTARRLVAIAKELQAAGGMVRDVRHLKRAHGEMVQTLRELEGLFHYRLYGDGATDDITGEKILTPEQEREAKQAWKNLSGIKKAVEGVWDELKKLDREISQIDDFMNYN